MPSHKKQRTGEDIKREIADIMRSLKDPRIKGMLSIVKCDITSDMSYCKVYISSMDGLAGAKSAVEGLNSASGFIRHELMTRLSLRRSPQVTFLPDDSIAHSAAIAHIIDTLK